MNGVSEAGPGQQLCPRLFGGGHAEDVRSGFCRDAALNRASFILNHRPTHGLQVFFSR